MSKISFVVPFFNEGKVLVKTVPKIHSYIKNRIDNFELTFVDDGSTDSSVKIIENYIKPYKNVKLLSYKKNKGRGEAIRQGFRCSKGSIIGYFDCDLEIKLKYIEEALKKTNSSDIIIASKFTKGSKIDTPFFRKISSFIYNEMVKIILGSKVSDHQAGFKFFNKTVIDDILSKTHEKGWLFDVELLYLAQKKNYTIYELPIEIRYGYRKLRGTFISDFLKLPIVLVKLKRRIDKRIKK